MKKILLLLLLMAMVPLYNKMMAQCTVSNVIVKVNSSSPSATVPGGCDVNFDFMFTLEHNNGNKYIYMHAWLTNEYPNYFNYPPAPNNAKPPVATDLLLAKINIGINNDITTVHPLPTLLSTYNPDPTVVLTPAASVTESNDITGDWFTIKGVQVTVPLGCSSIINMMADFWSSNANNAQNAQCVFAGQAFTIDPRINGFINCITPRTFNVVISSVAASAISGTYEVYIDNPSDPTQSGSVGTYGPEDNLMVYSSAYSTSGTFPNQYVASGITYPPYNTQKPQSDRNLWVVVSTTIYNNKVINLLVNGCAPLDLKLVGFNAAKNNGKAMVQWKTELEVNMSGFSVERKISAGQFEQIAFVQAESLLNTETGSFTYTYTDNGLVNGNVIFYRLKMIGTDGTFAYSDIKAIRNDGKKMYVTIHPNPNNGIFKVAVPVDAGVYDVIVTDYCGKMLKTMYSLRNQNLQINNLLPGVYILKIIFRESGESITERIIVQ